MIAVLVADCASLQRANCSEAVLTRRELLLSATLYYWAALAFFVNDRVERFLAAGFGGVAADDGGNAGVSNKDK